MKKIFAMFTCLLGVFAVSNGYSQDGCSPCAAPCAQPTGECYCKYVEYQACPYTTTQCVEEKIDCPRRCCRYVPQYYQVQCCRYVPQYYSVTKCRQVPEYYTVMDCKTRCKRICIPQCRYVPRYYWKAECKQPCC